MHFILCIFKNILRPWLLYQRTLYVAVKNRVSASEVGYRGAWFSDMGLKLGGDVNADVNLQWRLRVQLFFLPWNRLWTDAYPFNFLHIMSDRAALFSGSNCKQSLYCGCVCGHGRGTHTLADSREVGNQLLGCHAGRNLPEGTLSSPNYSVNSIYCGTRISSDWKCQLKLEGPGDILSWSPDILITLQCAHMYVYIYLGWGNEI